MIYVELILEIKQMKTDHAEQVTKLETDIADKQDKIDTLNSDMTAMKNQVAAKTKEIENLKKEQLAAAKDLLAAKDQEIAEAKAATDDAVAKNETLTKQLETAQAELDGKDKQVENLKQVIDSKDEKIGELNQTVAEWKDKYGVDNGHGTVFEGTDGWVHVDRGGIKTYPENLAKTQFTANDVRLIESNNHVRNLLDCVKTREEPIANIDEAVKADALCQISDIAMRLETELTWNPKMEKFVGEGSEGANRRLSKSMRGPWKL